LKAAVRKAGIVKDPDPVRELLHWWQRARPEQRADFLDLVMAERGDDPA
jgi:hypothetical protein